MAFFKLFPTDLLVFILSTWVPDGENGLDTGNQLLRMLSSLDVACCSHSQRGDVLLTLRCMQFPCDAYCYPTKLPTAEPVEHLQWLVDRQIALKKMFLSDDKIEALAANPMHLPSIHELRVSSPDSSGCLPAVLTLFPNLTALSLLDSSNPPSCGHLWEVLTTTHLPHLKVLMSSWCPESMEDVVVKALLLNGAHLEELDILRTKITTKLTPAIAACPQLVVLKMEVIKLTVADILYICRSCKLLKDITMQWFRGTITELDEILHSCAALRRLTVSLASPLVGRPVNAYDLLVHIFNTRTLLEVVNVGEGCSYCRQTKHLQLTQYIDDDMLEHIQQARFPVKMLTIVNKSSNGQSITTRAIAHYGPTLLELTVDLCLVSDEAFACKLVALCPLLQKLSLSNISAVDALLTCISINCRQV